MPHQNRRTGVDACPGALDVHQAADGGLARVRLPGGRVTSAQLRVLAAASAELGSGGLELTSRGNVQIRGLGPGGPAELGARLAAAGLLPSISHEKVRNIMSSPLGPAGPARDLDAALCADPALAALPGRFLFALDSGAGDVAWLGADVATLPVGDRVAVLLGGVDYGVRVGPGAVVAAVVEAARAFLDVRDGQWRIAELGADVALIAARLGVSDARVVVGVPPSGGPLGWLGAVASGWPGERQGWTVAAGRGERQGRVEGAAVPSGRPSERHGWAEVTAGQPDEPQSRAAATAGQPGEQQGWVKAAAGQPYQQQGWAEAAAGQPDEQRGWAVGAAVPLGRLDGRQIEVLARWPEVVITPWRGVVVPGGDLAALAAVGLLVDPAAPGIGVTACTGRPGCAKSLADVRADALRVGRPGRPVHFAGCGRRCGRPVGDVVDVVAVEGGYVVDGRVVPGDEAAEAAAVRREHR